MLGRLVVCLAILGLLGLALLTPSLSHAQYMYLDANGDGVHTSEDVVQPSGETLVDVWLITDRNRDGTPATCASNPDAPLNISFYDVVLRVVSGSVVWGTFTNAMPPRIAPYLVESDSTEHHVAVFVTSVGPGAYRLGSISLRVATATPQIDIAPRSRLSPGWVTSFASSCPGTDGDNTINLGDEWVDADGLPYGGVNRAPTMTPPRDMDVSERSSAVQTLTATDPDGAYLSFSRVGGPAFVSVTTVGSTPGFATGRVHVAPGRRDAGSYLVTIQVTDGVMVDEETFYLDVSGVTEVVPTGGKVPFVVEHAGRVRARLFDVRGRLRKTLIDQDLPAGTHELTVDRRDSSGRLLGSGMYFYRIETPTRVTRGRVSVITGRTNE